MLLGATLCLTVLLFNGAALAGPEPLLKNVVSQEVVVPFNWSGFYIGGNVGGNWTYSDFGFHLIELAAGAIEDDAEGDPNSDDFIRNDVDRATLLSPSVSGNSDISFLGGGQVGYQRQFGNVVIGLEGDFDAGTGNGDDATTTSLNVFNLVDDSDTVNSVFLSHRRTEVNWQASIRARLGWAKGRFLFYGTGGAAVADVSTRSTDTITSHVFDTFNTPPTEEEGGVQIHSVSGGNNDTVVGWTAGAGTEYALCRMLSLGIEYRHNDFGDTTMQSNRSRTPYISPGNTRLGLSGDQVTMRVNILLGHR